MAYNLMSSTPTEESWLGSMGISDSTYNTFTDAEKKGLMDSYNNLYPSKGTSTLDSMSSYLDKEGMFGLTNNQWGNLGQMSGLAGTAYGLYDSMFGNKAKLFKEQLGMLKEQRAANQEMLANKRKFNETWSNASNGLASRYAQPQVG